MRIVDVPGWPRPLGYSNAVEARGRVLYVAGQVGWDENYRFQTDDLIGQARQALKNTLAVLAAGGARPEHVVRMTWYITDKREYLKRTKEFGAAYRAAMGKHFPAMAMVQVAALMEDRAKIEVETTAVIPSNEGPDGA